MNPLNKMKWVGPIAIVLTFVAFVSCQNKKYNIPKEVRSYVAEFRLEADRRGVEITVSNDNLLIDWADFPKPKKGQCRPEDLPKKITLDRQSWATMDDYQRKVLIFHEMAHCFLGRPKHRNEILLRGDCKSLLTGSENGFNCHCNLYSRAWQEYYIEEIFDESTPAPDWYYQDTSYYRKEMEAIPLLDSMATYFYLTKERDLKSNFQIESTYSQANHVYGNLSIANYGINIDTKKRTITLFAPGKMTVPIEQTSVQLSEKEGVKLTLRWWQDFIYFYCNEQLIHKSDFQYSLENPALVSNLERSDTIAAYQAKGMPKLQLTISNLTEKQNNSLD